VPIYQWALPEDLGPLEAAVHELAAGKIDVALFTTSVQVTHLFQIAAEMNLQALVQKSLGRVIVASIGPTTSEELQRHGIRADLEPSHPKMGFLVKETAEHSGELLRRKRQSIASAG
jgi:uroporphyrinogen-III synthase